MPKSCLRAAQMGSPRKHWRYALWDRVRTVFLWWVILTFGLTDQFMQKHQRRLEERVLRGVSGNLQQRIEVAFEEVCREHSKSREEILGESIRLAWPWVQASLILYLRCWNFHGFSAITFKRQCKLPLEIYAWMFVNLPGALPSLLLNMFKMFQMPISKTHTHSFVS